MRFISLCHARCIRSEESLLRPCAREPDADSDACTTAAAARTAAAVLCAFSLLSLRPPVPPPQMFVPFVYSRPGARGLTLKAFSASLPVGAGLGSSAALCVATAAALTRLADDISRGTGSVSNNGGVGGGDNLARKSASDAVADKTTGAAAGEGADGKVAGGKQGGGSSSSGGSGGQRPSQADLERINAWAFAGETVLHGTPSGLDNTVSCYGGAIKFVKGMDGAGNTTEVRGLGA